MFEFPIFSPLFLIVPLFLKEIGRKYLFGVVFSPSKSTFSVFGPNQRELNSRFLAAGVEKIRTLTLLFWVLKFSQNGIKDYAA